MPLRSEWRLQREGFTIDTVLSLIKRTALNPLYTLPLYLYSLYTPKGLELALQRPQAAKWLKTLATLTALRLVSNFLDKGVSNNWTNDTYDWSKEIVLVTGGSDGIGAQVVNLLAERGIKVVVLDVQPLKYVAGPNVHYFHCDLADPTAIRYIAGSVAQHVGHPTVLINNAGFARGKSILETSETDLNLTFKINTFSHYFLAQAFLPAMIERNHGMVITVASLAAYVTTPKLVDYTASKAAALVFHEGLQTELATMQKAPAIRTVVVCQGYTRTALFDGFYQGDPFLNYPLDPVTVAEEIVRAVLRGQSDHIVLPRASSIMAGFRNWPVWAQGVLRKDLKKMMTGWKGRQVEQPSEAGTGKSPTSLLDASGVLVSKE